ncbi:hypothetical protein SeLEV6574_g02289 [Synchytrium endobioticum]|nr:hypothetical protein SeLEV6574_g02289 [Synchytrium endobioticum]
MLANTDHQTDGASLRTEFLRGQALFKNIEEASVASIDTAYQARVSECINCFTKCALMVRQLSLFSNNEQLDDIVTTDLRYILVDFYLGDVTLKQVSPSLNPLQVINVGEMYLSRYLTTLDDYGILPAHDATRWHAMIQKNEAGDLIASSRPEQAVSRDEKIARYKREKETKMRLQDLFARRQDQDADEAVERDIILTSATLYAKSALESIKLIRDERVLLLQMEKARRDDKGDGSSTLDKHSAERPDWRRLNGPLMDSERRILRPFVITSKREELRRGVFRPSWNLPTMTIEEYLDLEAERGNILHGTGDDNLKKEVDDLDYEAQDQETLKARDWDDFKDANPKGSGNRGGNRG